MPLIAVLLLLAASLAALVFMLNALWNAAHIRVPFVPTPSWAVCWLVNNLPVPVDSVVYDLGCGSGTMLVPLAQKNPQATFVGVELQWWPLVLAKWRTRKLPNITIRKENFFQTDLADATHVFVYLFSQSMRPMGDRLRTALNPGTTVISYGFSFPDWTIAQEIKNPAKPNGSRILLYRA